MEVFPLELPDLPEAVQQGDVRRISRGPLTVSQVLGQGLAAMLDDDEAQERQRDPIAYIRARRPRLIDRLLGRT